MEQEYVDYSSLAGLLAPQTQALQALAMRPQKTSTVTTTTSSSTPRALQNMIENRDRIRTASRELDDALRARETLPYTLANALSTVPQQQGYGSWVSDFARGLGGGGKMLTDAQMARAQMKRDNEMKDLAEILEYDKAMGDIKNSRQTQIMEYTPMEYSGLGGAGAGGRGMGAGTDSIGGIQSTNFGRSVGYDPVENLPEFGPVTRAALSEEELGTIGKYIPGAQSAAKGIAGKTATQLQSTWSDISDNILTGRVLDFVGKAGGVRVADTPAEQEFIFGPIRNYRNMSREQLQAGLKQARNNFVALGMRKWKEKQAQARAQGIEIPDISEKDLRDWWNSAFSVPEGLETETMYNIQNRPEKPVKSNKISVGGVRNGWRFTGGDPNKKENWEKVE